jgi:hypothetical protein
MNSGKENGFWQEHGTEVRVVSILALSGLAVAAYVAHDHSQHARMRQAIELALDGEAQATDS